MIKYINIPLKNRLEIILTKKISIKVIHYKL